MAADPEILTPSEVCEMLRIHRGTLYKLVRAGKIPTFRIGSEWRFRRDLLERWMFEQTKMAPRPRRARTKTRPGAG